MLRYAAKLTLEPRKMIRADVQTLRDAGFDDGEILEINQIVACFAFMNRLADGTGVQLYDKHLGVARALFSEAQIAEHMAWGQADKEAGPSDLG